MAACQTDVCDVLLLRSGASDHLVAAAAGSCGLSVCLGFEFYCCRGV